MKNIVCISGIKKDYKLESLKALRLQRRASNRLSVATKQNKGKKLNLNFSIIFEYAASAEILSTVYNIDDMVEVRFKFVCSSENLSTLLSLKKHDYAKDINVKVDVQCETLNYAQKLLSAQHCWLWQDMGVKRPMAAVDSYYLVSLPINITVFEEKLFNADKIFEDEDFTDFKLGTGEGHVTVHKVHLAAHSEVFKTMLAHEWKETTEGTIQLAGVTLQTLQHLKKYIYLGTLPDDGLQSLLLLARCYLIDDLKTACILKLARTATAENLEDLVNFASDNKLTELLLALIQLPHDDVVHGAYQLKKTEPKNNQR